VAATVIDLRQQPWWTPADRAEFDALIRCLVDRLADHEGHCELCAAGYPPCPHVCAAIENVITWRDMRVQLSVATWLRLGQDRLEQAAEQLAEAQQ
jgi:hypothetical protein